MESKPQRKHIGLAIGLLALTSLMAMFQSISEITGVGHVATYRNIFSILFNISNMLSEDIVSALVIAAWLYVGAGMREHFTESRLLLGLYIFMPLAYLFGEISPISLSVALGCFGCYVGIKLYQDYLNTSLVAIAIMADSISSAIYCYIYITAYPTVWLEIISTATALFSCYALWRYFKEAPLYVTTDASDQEEDFEPQSTGKTFSRVIYVLIGILLAITLLLSI